MRSRDASTPRTPSRRSKRFRETSLAYVMLAPSLVIFAIFVFYPFIKNFTFPFYQTSTAGGFGAFANESKPKWVGWEQWGAVLGSRDFWHSVWVTVQFVGLTVPLGIALGLLLAVIAHQKLAGITFYRTIFSSTVASSAAVASTIFFSLVGTHTGLWTLQINGHGILDDKTWALPAIAGVSIWQSLGLSFIVMSSGLQAIPDDLLEAARVDGAGASRRFLRVTLPLLSPTVFFAFVVGSISAFKTFAEIDLLNPIGKETGGTSLLAYQVKRLAFDSDSRTGQAAVFAVGLFAIVLMLTLIQMRLERRVHYAR